MSTNKPVKNQELTVGVKNTAKNPPRRDQRESSLQTPQRKTPSAKPPTKSPARSSTPSAASRAVPGLASKNSTTKRAAHSAPPTSATTPPKRTRRRTAAEKRAEEEAFRAQLEAEKAERIARQPKKLALNQQPPRRTLNDKMPEILADWHTGEYNIMELARRHDVNRESLSIKLKNVVPQNALLVDDLVDVQQRIKELPPVEAVAVQLSAKERLHNIEFFDELAKRNAKMAADKLNDHSTQRDHYHAAKTISISRSDVLGKAPDTVNNINVGTAQMSTTDLLQAAQALTERITKLTPVN